MGMDIFGSNPISEEGRYFRRNVWTWRPLVELVTELCPEETAACELWQSNDGDGLDAAESEKLAARLFGLLESGVVEAYCTLRDARLTSCGSSGFAGGEAFSMCPPRSANGRPISPDRLVWTLTA